MWVTAFTSTRSPSIASEPRRAAARTTAVAAAGAIRVGIGGWNYEPWRDNFYPPGLSHARELEFASRRLTAIEINATYYRTQSPQSFAKWRDATPDGFIFAVKASRFATNRRVLGEAGESIARFVSSGLAELGDKLGPLVWQFATTKQFDPDDFGAFLDLLPKREAGVSLRHVVEVRHTSFMVPAFTALARKHGVATVFADSPDYPSFADVTADFVYARLMNTVPDEPTGYPPGRIAFWGDCARRWASGREPEDLPKVTSESPVASGVRDVFMFFISGAKERAPAAAMATLDALGLSPPQG